MPYAHYMLKYTGSAYAIPATVALVAGDLGSAAVLGTLATTSYMYHSRHTNRFWAAADKVMVYFMGIQGLHNSTGCPYRMAGVLVVCGLAAGTYWVGYMNRSMSFCIRYGSIYHALFLHLLPQLLALVVLTAA